MFPISSFIALGQRSNRITVVGLAISHRTYNLRGSKGGDDRPVSEMLLDNDVHFHFLVEQLSGYNFLGLSQERDELGE
jgi:hypothetical protein